jgi:ParB family transcriptional regulator, chromosome partitioning protein
MNKRGGLGRGLAALIPTGPAPDAAPVVRATPADGAGPDREPGAASLPQVAPTVTLVPDPAPSPVAASPNAAVAGGGGGGGGSGGGMSGVGG